MSNLIQKALTKAGYDSQPTESNLTECFLDYVDSGVFSNLTTDEAEDMIEEGELTVNDMCRALLRL